MKWLWLSSGVIVLDQLTKRAASGTLELYQSLPLLPSVNLTLTHNTGAAFSLLDQAGGWQRWFFAAIALVVSACIVFWLYRLPRGKVVLAAGLSLILGGALGNLWDRLSLGYVIDFIDLYYSTWHWPAFNVADSAITIGAGLLIVDAFSRPAEG
ncbi:MAG: signal peptidase II [Gammaproteobacteria bacterium]